MRTRGESARAAHLVDEVLKYAVSIGIVGDDPSSWADRPIMRVLPIICRLFAAAGISWRLVDRDSPMVLTRATPFPLRRRPIFAVPGSIPRSAASPRIGGVLSFFKAADGSAKRPELSGGIFVTPLECSTPPISVVPLPINPAMISTAPVSRIRFRRLPSRGGERSAPVMMALSPSSLISAPIWHSSSTCLKRAFMDVSVTAEVSLTIVSNEVRGYCISVGKPG